MDAVGSFEDGINVTKLSKQLRMGKSTVHRLLGTLLVHDVVRLDPKTSRYSLGSKIVRWNDMLLRQNLLVRCGLPILGELAGTCGGICNLAILEGIHVVFVAQYESQTTRGLRLTKGVGARELAHSTSLGKALLATLTDAELDDLYPSETLERITENTIASREKLKEHLQQVRAEGVAYDFEENALGVTCLGTLVQDCLGRPIGAISISSPVTHLRRGNLLTLKNYLLSAAQQLSTELGHGARSGAPNSSLDEAVMDELAPNMLDLMAGKLS